MKFVKNSIMCELIRGKNMGWKKLAIISLIILLSIDAILTSEYSNTKPICSFKRISCLDETSFKFCFWTGSVTYLYGEIKYCPKGTVCSEYEGINACIEFRNELVNAHDDYPIEETTSSGISSEHTIALPPVTITEVQNTETNTLRSTLSTTLNYMIQSTYPFDIPKTTALVALDDDVQSNHSKYDLSTDQSIRETMKSITFPMSGTASEDISHQTNTQDILHTVTKQKRKPTTNYSPTVTKRERKPITLSIRSSTTPDDYSSRVTKRKRKSTTPSTTPGYSSKIKKRKKKPTISSTGHYSKVTKRRKATSPASPHAHSSKVTKRRRKSTSSPSAPISNFPNKVTKHVKKFTATPSITHDYSFKVTKRRWKSTTKKPYSKLKKRRKKPISSTYTNNFSNVTVSTETISSNYKATTATDNREETLTDSNTFASENPVTEVKSVPIKNYEISTTSSSFSTNYDVGKKSTSIYSTPSVEQSAVSTQFPCQHYLLKILKNISPVTVVAANSIRTEENPKQTEVEELTPPSACTSSGKYPSRNCNEYYECLKVMWWYRLMYRKCHKREKFDSKSLQCVPDISCN